MARGLYKYLLVVNRGNVSTSIRHTYKVQGPSYHHNNILSNYINRFDYYFRESWLLYFAAFCFWGRNAGEKTTLLQAGDYFKGPSTKKLWNFLISNPLPPTSLTDSLHFSWSFLCWPYYTYLYMYCLVYTYIRLILYLCTNPTSYFTLALFPRLTVKFLKISRVLVILESTRSQSVIFNSWKVK